MMQDTASSIPVVIRPAPRPKTADRHVEICEHKGIGHPDTITDGVCEAIACELAQVYRRQFGQVLHFNVDKGLLVAGRAAPKFGGGRLIAPVKLIVCGRAVNPGGTLDLRALATGAAEHYLANNIRSLSGQFIIVPEIEEGSLSLQQIYTGGRRVALANDTSFGVGFAPYSTLERRVLKLASIMKSPAFRARYPAAGDDFKIMGLRVADSFTFTIAIAFIDRHVASVGRYFELKCEMQHCLVEALQADCALRINALDDPAAQDESGLYLTVSGLSAEMGDDGQVGRGNRVSGLITPGRPMSLEAAAGKNPVAHVGKIYNVLAHRLAGVICRNLPEAEEASVQLLSTIGRPIDQPQAVVVELAAGEDISPQLSQRVKDIVTRELARIAELTDALERGSISVF